MNRKKKRETLLEDTSALSEVVGFVLIMALLLSVTSIYISRQVPELTKDFEARHADEVVDDFSELDSLVDGIVLVAKLGEVTSEAAATKSIKMSPGRVPLLGMSPAGASIAFLRGEEEIFGSSPLREMKQSFRLKIAPGSRIQPVGSTIPSLTTWSSPLLG